MAWKVEGTYFENCNCKWVCPCSVTSFAAAGTEDRCQVVLVYHVDRGEADGVNISGLNVALVADTPPNMLDGKWRLGLIIDEKASAEQADKLGAVFGGAAGGPIASLAPLVGEMLGIERASMEYSSHGHRHSVRIGDLVDIEVEDYVPEGQSEPTRLQGVNHPSNSTLAIAKPTRSKIKAFGMEFHNEGRSAFSAPYSWSA
ncbi:MAG TPA: DUF1326 domain-containing protein [Candidatus Dormibacteraeota bacterium]|jgi:hypothetical protein